METINIEQLEEIFEEFTELHADGHEAEIAGSCTAFDFIRNKLKQ